MNPRIPTPLGARLPPHIAATLARAAEFSEPVSVSMTPHEWRVLAHHLGLTYTPHAHTNPVNGVTVVSSDSKDL